MTIDDVINAVREKAAESPDVTYKSPDGMCFYTKGTCSDGSIGCIFGQVLSKMGVDVSLYDDWGKSTTIRMLLKEIINDKPNDYYKKADWCAEVQHAQDNGATWEQAISIADKRCQW